MIEISIILPVFNEEKTIERVISLLVNLPVAKEIIVVNDGSTDRTAEILKMIQNKDSFKLIEHRKNYGKGRAVRTGIENTKGEFLVIQDGDMEQRPQDIVAMLQKAKGENLAVVFGTRMTNKNSPFNIWFLANKIITLVTNILFNSHLTDVMTGYKLCKTEIAKNLQLESDGFDIEPEITAKLLKQRIQIYEVPIFYKPRTKSDGKKICFWDTIKVIKRILLEKTRG